MSAQEREDWLPPYKQNDQLEYYRDFFHVIHISNKEISSTQERLKLGLNRLHELASYRKIKDDEIWTVFDIDNVLRNPQLQFFNGTPGRLPNPSLMSLKQEQSNGVEIGAFVTNQPLDGHQVARVYGWFKGYSTIKSKLKNNFLNTPIFSAGNRWDFIWHHTKREKAVVSSVTKLIKNSSRNLFAYFGDRYQTDGNFWLRVHQQLPSEVQEKLVFVKMPNNIFKSLPASRLTSMIP